MSDSNTLLPRVNAVILAYIPAVLWASGIFILSSMSALPSLDFSLYDFIFKKTAHIVVYAVLFVLLWHADTRLNPTRTTSQRWILPALICLGYAISDEIHQSFVPGRYATLRDIGFDMLGCWIVLLRKYHFI